MLPLWIERPSMRWTIVLAYPVPPTATNSARPPVIIAMVALDGTRGRSLESKAGLLASVESVPCQSEPLLVLALCSRHVPARHNLRRRQAYEPLNRTGQSTV